VCAYCAPALAHNEQITAAGKVVQLHTVKGERASKVQ